MRTATIVLGLVLLSACSQHKTGTAHPPDMSAHETAQPDLAGAGDLGVGSSSDLSGLSGHFTISGTITGLSGYGLVLQNNSGDDLSLKPNSATFAFATSVANGAKYQVTIRVAPNHPSETCVISNGSGTATANITNVAIACTTDPADWLQFNFDAQHSGWSAQETILTPTTVKTLKAKMNVTLPEVVDGAPAYLRNVSTASGMHDLLFVVTRAADLIALDSVTLAQVWLKPHPAATACTINNGGNPCYTTSSPAVDPNRMFVYAYGLDGTVHKHNVGDGSEITTGGWPETATIKGFDEKGSSALAIAAASSGTYLYVTHAGYPGDNGDYQGHVTTINLATGAQHVFNANCSNYPDVHFDEAPAVPSCPQTRTAVWGRSGVVYSAALDRLFFATGNGVFDANMPNLYDWGDSVLAIHPDGTGTATGPLDSYTPTEQGTLNANDADLGSSAPALLPTPPGSKYAHLAVQAQKKPNASEALLRILNLDNLSGQGAPGKVGGEIEKINVPQGNEVLTAVAVWVNPADGSDWIFVANDNGISGIRIDIAADGTPSFSTTKRWTKTFGCTSPIVVNNMVFVATTAGMQALDPTTGTSLWTDTSIGGLHWESPIVVGGQLYVTDQNKAIWRYSL